MPKKSKSKPKQRTNWKQRALHCEGAIKIQNVLAESREKRADKLDKGMRYWADRAEAAENRATSAEKHNALLLEEREVKPFYCEICGTELSGPSLKSHALCTNRACYVASVRNNTPPTHWQRFKSFLKLVARI